MYRPYRAAKAGKQHTGREIELSFVDEDGEGVYGVCDDDAAANGRPKTDLDRLLDAPVEPTWHHVERGGNEWTVSTDAAASFGVVAVTDGRDTLAL
jgi:hypothetical protein